MSTGTYWKCDQCGKEEQAEKLPKYWWVVTAAKRGGHGTWEKGIDPVTELRREYHYCTDACAAASFDKPF